MATVPDMSFDIRTDGQGVTANPLDPNQKKETSPNQIIINVSGGTGAGGQGDDGKTQAKGGEGMGGTANNSLGHGNGVGGEVVVPALLKQFAFWLQKTDQFPFQASTPIAPPPPVSGLVVDKGVEKREESRPWYNPMKSTEECISFSQPFQSPPTVAVNIRPTGLSKFISAHRVRTTNISSRGFTIHVDSWANWTSYSYKVLWMAMGE
ncbi:hypothetical protein M426DRAFT_265073 [Hypoxylon sp. CI-4A]|nr:hypothetical protein M426DRAFT_265073 [Hypoxylon sp. CI-4A]